MSPNTPNDFIGSLVEMAEAYRELPKVQEALSDAQGEIGRLTNTVARLEAKLMDRSNEITAHLATIRSLEVERDDAQFHALEADDRTQRALDFIKATFGNAGTLIQALEPPAKSATPDVSVQAMPEAKETAEPMKSDEELFKTATEHPDLNERIHANNELATRQGVDADTPPAPEVAPMQASPTPSPAASPSADHPPGIVSNTATPQADVSVAEPTPFSAPPIDRGKYHGLSYSEAHAKEGPGFSWPSLDEWLSNGGSLDQFYA